MTQHITALVLGWLAKAVETHMPEDHAQYDVSFMPLPDDTGWLPSLVLYVQLQPVGELDGWHNGEWISPYAITEEYVDFLVHQMADDTAKLRQELREARAAGKPVRLGVAADTVAS